MPSLEIKSLRNRKRTRSRLHLSSTPTSPTGDPSSSTEKLTLHPLTTTTGPSSSSSDERRGHKSPGSSISSSSLFDDEQWKRVVRLRERDGLRDTVWWGYVLLGTNWTVFILGMGGVCGVWEWSLKPIRPERPTEVRLLEGDR
jgi:hypothetical protein